jgi:toxin-antitoxin system PIN domain toxin
VILVDTNVWLALALPPHRFHPAARQWFSAQTVERSVLFCRATQQSFLRLLTTEAVMRAYGLSPSSNADAWTVYEGMRADRRVRYASEPQHLETHWQQFAARNVASPKLWMDAYLAAFAVAGDYDLLTTDKAFQQFKELRLSVLSPI